MTSMRTAAVALFATLSITVAAVTFAVGGHHEATAHSGDESTTPVAPTQQSTR
jgi:hypothetical protein